MMKKPIYDNLWHQPNVGSQDMTRISGLALDNYYTVNEFKVCNDDLIPLSPEHDHDVSEKMKEIISKYGGKELNFALRDDFNGLYITEVSLHSETYNEDVSVVRHGGLEFSDNSNFWNEIYHDFKGFFTELRIGNW